jgi:glutamine amidotransferase
MCLLTFAPAGVHLDPERLWQASLNNPHGFGFAVRTQKGIIRSRGMNFEKVYDNYVSTLSKYHGDSMFHHRFATHGTVNKQNCHPFYVGNDKDTLLGHNGIIPIEIPKGDVRSDTRYFSEVLMPEHGGVAMLDNPEYVTYLEKAIGYSKLVIMTNSKSANSPFYIVNENLGDWDDGAWWSNTSYEKPKPRVYSYSSYSTPSYTTRSYSHTEDTDWDEYSFETTCPLCDIDIVVNERTGETCCPTCDVCLLCEEFSDDCWCVQVDTNTYEDDEEIVYPYSSKPFMFY